MGLFTSRPKAGPIDLKISGRIRGKHSKLRLDSPKEPEEFDVAATELATALGWAGEETWELNRIRVADARKFLRRTLHQAYQAERNPGKVTMPEATKACKHLGLSDSSSLRMIEKALSKATREAV